MLKSLSKWQRTAEAIFWAVLFVVVLVGIVVGWDTIGRWLAMVGGSIVALLGGMKAIDKKELERIKAKNQAIKEAIEKQQGIKTDLDARAKSWRERKNKLHQGTMILLVCAVLCLAAGAVRAEIYIPEDYDHLKALYLQAMELLDEADQIIQEYEVLTRDQAVMIGELQEDVIRLSRPVWGLTGGLELAERARYKVGIAYKKGWISYAGGFGGGGDGFCVWGSVTVWWQSPF